MSRNRYSEWSMSVSDGKRIDIDFYAEEFEILTEEQWSMFICELLECGESMGWRYKAGRQGEE